MVGYDERISREDPAAYFGTWRSILCCQVKTSEKWLWNADQFPKMLLDTEDIPCLSASCIKAPAMIAFFEEDVDQDAVAACNVDETWEDVFGSLGGFDPVSDEVGSVGLLEARVSILDEVLRNDCVLDRWRRCGPGRRVR